MRRLIGVLEGILVPSLLATALSGPVACCFLAVVTTIGLSGFWVIHLLSASGASHTAAFFLKMLESLLVAPFLGLLGSILLWRVTLPYGLILVLVQRVTGPSRIVAVVVSALYAGAWTEWFGQINPFTGHSIFPLPAGLEASTSGTHPGSVALPIGIGALVGFLMPWRFLLQLRPRTPRTVNEGRSEIGSRPAG